MATESSAAEMSAATDIDYRQIWVSVMYVKVPYFMLSRFSAFPRKHSCVKITPPFLEQTARLHLISPRYPGNHGLCEFKYGGNLTYPTVFIIARSGTEEHYDQDSSLTGWVNQYVNMHATNSEIVAENLSYRSIRFNAGLQGCAASRGCNC